MQRLLRSCLEKDPKRRLQAIGDWRFLLDEPAVPATAARPGVARWVWPAVASALAVALAALAYVQFREQPVDRPLARLDVDLGADVSLATAYGGSDVVISPDGTRLVYIASLAGGPASLFLRRLDQPKAAELPGTQGASAPFFSPEGQWAGFTAANGKLSKIPVEGGAPIPLADAGSSTGSSWGEDGNMIDSILGRGLFRIPSVGGAAAPVELVNGETSFMAPQILPGAKAILFSVYPQTNDPDRARIEVLSLADHRRKIVAQGGTSARYVATSNKSGYLVYANRATLFAVPFDLDRLEKRGTPVAVLDDVGFTPDSYESQFDVSRSGTMVYRKAAAGSADPMATIQWMDAAGKQAPLSFQARRLLLRRAVARWKAVGGSYLGRGKGGHQGLRFAARDVERSNLRRRTPVLVSRLESSGRPNGRVQFSGGNVLGSRRRGKPATTARAGWVRP